jgi:hypothetical protein
VLVFVYASPRVGSVPALWGATLMAFLGPGWQNIVWPFQIGWSISLAAGVATLLFLDREGRRGDVLACVCIAVALASSGLGVAIALGVTVELLLRRRVVRGLWIVVLPLIPYGVWWLVYRPGGIVKENIDQTLRFVADSAAGSLSALTGLVRPGMPELDALQWGRPLAAVAALALVWLLMRYPRIPPRVAGLLTIVFAFWLLTGLRRAMLQQPDASRYLYVGALFVLLLAVELARGRRATSTTLAVVSVLVAAVAVTNAGTLRDAGRYLRAQAAFARADLAALDIARDRVGSGYVAHFPGFPFILLDAQRYRDAAAADGTPAYSLEELRTAPEPARALADTELIRADGLTLRAAPGGTAGAKGACAELRPPAVRSGATIPSVEATVPTAGVLIETTGSPARVQVRRFAPTFASLPRDTIERSSAAVLRPGADTAPDRWRVRVSAQERVSVCGLR